MHKNKRVLECLAVGVLAVAMVGCGDSDTEAEASSTTGTAPVVYTDACEGQASGTACTWLGVAGEDGYNGEGNQRFGTKVSLVQDLLFMPDGSAWFTDFNNYLVRRVMTDGMVEAVVGATDPTFPGDGPPGGIKPEGAEGSTWSLNHPTELLHAADGDVILIAWHNHKLLKINQATGFVKNFGGAGAGFAGDGGPVAKALYKQPSDGTIDEDGNIYVVDQQNWRIRKIDATGNISSIAGKGTSGSTGDGGPAMEAEFSWAAGSNPNPSGGITYHDGKLYIAETENHRIRVMDLATGMIDAFAGTGAPGFSGDGGPALTAKLQQPRDLEVGPDGDLYFVDTDNGAVRAIDLDTGDIRTVIGTGELGLSEEEQLPATETLLRRPFGLTFDADGNLYVADTNNSRIVKVAK